MTRQAATDIRRNGLKTDDDERAATTTTSAFLNVRDFGALGDGKHDDASAIQSAIDTLAYKAGAPGGGILVFPSGVYCVSAQLNSSAQGNHLMGSGYGPNSNMNNPW
jgi:polygalacturonase